VCWYSLRLINPMGWKYIKKKYGKKTVEKIYKCFGFFFLMFKRDDEKKKRNILCIVMYS
jgi:hypothetical protein